MTLSTQDNINLLKQLNLRFERRIKWKKYQSNATTQTGNQYLDYLIDQSFQGVNTFFVLSLKNNAPQTSYKQYFPPTVEIEDYIVMINGQNVFDQPVKNDQRTYSIIRKITIG